jgi:aminomethyltransferase
MTDLRRVPLHDRHVALGAKLVDFAGWAMPLSYPDGVIAEHLATRAKAGLFDVSHMGRFAFRGEGSLGLLQRVLSSDVATLEVGRAQYAFVPTATGGAIDDAYLYRFVEDEYLLVVNAANRQKDWEHLGTLQAGRPSETGGTDGAGGTQMFDRSDELVMLALQGPESEAILAGLVGAGALPEPKRNRSSTVTMAGVRVLISRTGYTGEPACFELFIPREAGAAVWDLLVERGATPCGLGARDTLRLEAGLPLYGHELGIDLEGTEIPVFSCLLARRAVSFSDAKGNFVGRAALLRQHEAYVRILAGDYSLRDDLPRLTRPVAVVGRGVPRAGSRATAKGRSAGWVTSGTMVPYWRGSGTGSDPRLGGEHGLRAICLAYLDSDLGEGDRVSVDVRGDSVEGVIVPRNLDGGSPPFSRPVLFGE